MTIDDNPLDVIVGVSIQLRRISGEVQNLSRLGTETLHELEVLVLLHRLRPPYRLVTGELLRRLHLTSGALTSRLDGLERSGHIRRERGTQDRRLQFVELTPLGVERLLTARDNLRDVDLGHLKANLAELH
jgi:DNA-binding MarR family transcriptional regulator